MANGTVHLPQELTDHVIGFLADDATALSACTLVCRAWSVKSTLLLFKILPVEWRQIHQFISSVHGLDRIREAVRKLHLGCCLCINAKGCACERAIRQVCDSSSEDSTSYPSADYLISMSDLHTVISLFPHLETATLYNLELSNVVATDPRQNASMKLQLQELILVDIWDMAIYPALSYQLLNAFKSIGNLKVFLNSYITDRYVDDGDMPGLDGDESPTEGRLSIGNILIAGPSAAILDPLQLLYQRQDLTRLDIALKVSDYQWDLPLMRRFIGCSTALEELCLDVPFSKWEFRRVLYAPTPQPWTLFKLPDLSGHSRLHTVHIHGLALRRVEDHNREAVGLPPRQNGTWAEIVDMLASASSTLRAVYLHASPHSPITSVPNGQHMEFDNYDWALLGRKLATFRSLRRVFIVLDARPGEAPAKLACVLAWTEEAERVASVLPLTVRAKVVFGAWKHDLMYIVT